jgi:hypothetical protein
MHAELYVIQHIYTPRWLTSSSSPQRGTSLQSEMSVGWPSCFSQNRLRDGRGKCARVYRCSERCKKALRLLPAIPAATHPWGQVRLSTGH